MTGKQIIIDGVDVAKCRCFTSEWDFNNCGHICKGTECKYKRLWYKEQLKRKEQECEELHSRTASIIYSLTGGRLSYSTYTLESCEQAYHDQLEIDVERATKELEEKLQAKEQECEVLQMSDNEAGEIIAELKAECKELKEKVKELHQGWIDCDKERNLQEANSEFRQRVINRYKQTLTKIIKLFEEDEKFARYSGRPIMFVKPTLEKIEKILKENDIKIS